MEAKEVEEPGCPIPQGGEGVCEEQEYKGEEEVLIFILILSIKKNTGRDIAELHVTS